jgi:DNA-binding XRE family transcriptional regulator
MPSCGEPPGGWRPKTVGDALVLTWGPDPTTALVTPDDLSTFRAEFGWTQAAFAEQLGVSRRTVQSWEHGVREPPFLLILAMIGLRSLHLP